MNNIIKNKKPDATLSERLIVMGLVVAIFLSMIHKYLDSTHSNIRTVSNPPIASEAHSMHFSKNPKTER